MEKIFVSIVLLPNKEINSEIISINKELVKKFNLNPIIEEDFAHISLYNATFPKHNQSIIEENLNNIFQDIKKYTVNPLKINIKSKFISVVFENNEELNKLQNTIIEKLNPLREGLIQSKYREKPESYSKEELENINLYGYPFCKQEFSPHITIAELQDISEGEEIIKEVKWEKIINIEKISVRILYTDDNGNKTRKVFYF